MLLPLGTPPAAEIISFCAVRSIRLAHARRVFIMLVADHPAGGQPRSATFESWGFHRWSRTARSGLTEYRLGTQCQVPVAMPVHDVVVELFHRHVQMGGDRTLDGTVIRHRPDVQGGQGNVETSARKADVQQTGVLAITHHTVASSSAGPYCLGVEAQ